MINYLLLDPLSEFSMLPDTVLCKHLQSLKELDMAMGDEELNQLNMT